MDDDPTPQSLAIHSMTQGEDEGDEGEEEEGEDDLVGEDLERSQFVTSGMEVDTPVKLGNGEISLRHRLLEHQVTYCLEEFSSYPA